MVLGPPIPAPRGSRAGRPDRRNCPATTGQPGLMGYMSEVAGATTPERSARRLLRTVIPALVVGVGASLLFLVIEGISTEIEHFLWDFLPDQLGFAGSDNWWIITLLT